MEPKDGSRPARRRGHGAAGWLGNSGGGLPFDVPPVAVASEAELRTELERLAGLLAPAVEWAKRVEALMRLEGLAKGGACGFASFPELLLTLRDVLAAQMQERRSAVSRQACHAVGELAAVCGTSFEPLALHLLPVVFKTLAMGIQVVSEVADACAHAMVAHCPSQRLLPRLCAVVSGDRNGRLRHSAAEYLLHALEAWPPGEVERQLEVVQRAVLAAAQDAQAETRVVGRSMYGVLAHTWPAQAHALLARLERDRQLQEKLVQAAQEYVPGMLPEGTGSSHPASRRSSLGNSGAATPRSGLSRNASMPGAVSGLQQGGASLRLAAAVPKLALLGAGSGGESGRGSPTHPAHSSSSLLARQHPSNPSTARENHSDNQSAAAPAAAVPCTPRTMFPKSLARREAAAAAAAGAAAEAEGEGEPSRQLGAAAAGRERMALRRSLGGAALRMSVATFRRAEPGEAPEEPGSQTSAAAPATAAAQRGVGLQRPAMRIPLPLPEPADAQQEQAEGAPSRPPAAGHPLAAPEDQPGGLLDVSEAGSQAGSLLAWEPAALPPAPASLPAALAGLGKAGLAWTDRVELYHSLQAAMEQAAASQAAVADMASNADRLVAVLLDGCGDAHFRVAAAALAALAAGLAGPGSRVFEPQLDRLLAILFARMTDSREQLRQLVGTALADVLRQHSADGVVAALSRSLQAVRAPKVKCAVMEFFAAAVSSGPDSADGQLQQQQQPALQLQQLTGTALLGLLRALVRLATDKNVDIRRAAAEAVAAAHQAGEAQAVAAALQALPPADAMAAQRAIRPAMQRLCGEAGNSSSPSRPASRAASATSSQSGSLAGQRRHSTDGPKQPPVQQQQLRPQSGSSSRSGQSSQGGWSPARARKQQGAAAAAQNPPAASAQLTPEPPSPFAWRVQPASPLPAAAAAAQPAAACQAADVARESGAAAAALQQAAPTTAASLAPFDDVMAAQLQRLLAQLEQGPGSEALQGLSRMVHVLPAAAWQPCFQQITAALCTALDSHSSVVQDAGLMATRDLAAAVQPLLFLPALPALLPRLLACAAQQEAPELALAADEALLQLLQRAPPQSCLGLLLPQLPAAGDQLSVDRQAGAQLHAAICSLRRVVCRMQPAGLSAHLQPLLVPGLCAAYRSPMSDVRKATVDCLVSVWQVVGDVLEPHLVPLSASQRKLLDIYVDKARGSAGY